MGAPMLWGAVAVCWSCHRLSVAGHVVLVWGVVPVVVAVLVVICQVSPVRVSVVLPAVRASLFFGCGVDECGCGQSVFYSAC